MSERMISRKPYVEVVEQPCKTARFTCNSENKSGDILIATDADGDMSYPTIRIVNHRGPACVVVSCVTNDQPPRPHPNNITGTGPGITQGICYLKIPADVSVISFADIAIQLVKKKDIIKSLTERENLSVNPFKTGFDPYVPLDEYDLSCVRLCFQVFVEGGVPGDYTVPLDPVVSTPIYDVFLRKKLIDAKLPKICWISRYSAPVGGGTVVCLLCEKVKNDGIQVYFFNETTYWEAIAELTPPKKLKEVAVIFKTPKYILQDIKEPVKVSVQLKRLSDGKFSKPIPFEFIPEEYASEDGFKAKRLKCHESPKDIIFRHLLEKFDQNANSTIGTNSWELPKTTMHNPSIVDSSPYNQTGVDSRNPSTSNAMNTGFNQAYYNEQPMTENSTMNNDFMQQTINSENKNPTDDQQNANEQTNQKYFRPYLESNF